MEILAFPFSSPSPISPERHGRGERIMEGREIFLFLLFLTRWCEKEGRSNSVRQRRVFFFSPFFFLSSFLPSTRRFARCVVRKRLIERTAFFLFFLSPLLFCVWRAGAGNGLGEAVPSFSPLFSLPLLPFPDMAVEGDCEERVVESFFPSLVPSSAVDIERHEVVVLFFLFFSPLFFPL